VISVLRPEAKLFGLRCLMIIGTEGGLGSEPTPMAPLLGYLSGAHMIDRYQLFSK